MNLRTDQDFRSAQAEHFLAISALSLKIDPDDTDAVAANKAEIENRALKMVHCMNAFLASLENQRKGIING